MRTIEFNGIEVKYDEKCNLSWKWQRAVSSGDGARLARAIDRLLLGRSDEIAMLLSGVESSVDDGLGDDDLEVLDESMALMVELLGVINEDMGRKAKN